MCNFSIQTNYKCGRYITYNIVGCGIYGVTSVEVIELIVIGIEDLKLHVLVSLNDMANL